MQGCGEKQDLRVRQQVQGSEDVSYEEDGHEKATFGHRKRVPSSYI